MTGVHTRAGVAGVRGLGRAGLDVVALAADRGAPGRWSRHAARRALGPAPELAPSAFVEAIASLARSSGPLVLYPGPDAAIDAVLEHRAALPSGALLPYPPDAVAVWRDKRELPRLAEAAGLRAPATLASGTAAELVRSGFPTRSVVKAVRPGGRVRGARLVESSDELERLAGAGRIPSDEPLLVQERLRGPLTSLELVVDRDGAVVERFQQRAERTSPAGAGLISSSVSVAADPDLVQGAGRMLTAAGYWGLAQLDLIEVGEGFAVLDVNPRFYSCLPLSLACGVNLPAAWHAVAIDDPVPALSEYESGRRFRWWEGEVVEALRGRSLARLRPAPRAAAGAMSAADDPLPGALLAGQALSARVRSAASRLRRRRR